MGTSLPSLWCRHLHLCNSSLVSFPSLSRASALQLLRSEACIAPAATRAQKRTNPCVYLCVSLLPWQETVAFHCHPFLPVLPWFSPLDLLSQCGRRGSGVAGSSPVQMPALWVLLCRCVYGSKVPKSPPGSFRTFSYFPGVSCWAAGCPPEGHSSPIVSRSARIPMEKTLQC